jgi:hypothetical protein
MKLNLNCKNCHTNINFNKSDIEVCTKKWAKEEFMHHDPIIVGKSGTFIDARSAKTALTVTKVLNFETLLKGICCPVCSFFNSFPNQNTEDKLISSEIKESISICRLPDNIDVQLSYWRGDHDPMSRI